MPPEEFKRFATQLAQQSARIIRPYFLSEELGVETKPDGTVVTRADREAEAALREAIRRQYPAHGILGEEFGGENEAAEFVWVLDPIDGTLSFLAGVPLFGTLIGLVHQGQPVLGIIHQPILEQLCLGDNETAAINGKPAQVRPCARLGDATLLVTDVTAVPRYRNGAGFEQLLGQVALARTWGDCYGYLLLAAGRADIMLDPIMNPWDLLPLVPIILGAGGTITTWTGGDPVAGDSCVAAHPNLHAEVLALLNRRPGGDFPPAR